MERAEHARLLAGEHSEPHRVLGAHPATVDGVEGAVVRAFHPDATAAECVLPDNTAIPLEPLGPGGLFAAFLPDTRLPLEYRLRFLFANGASWEIDDPYRFLPTLGDLDLHLFGEGKHRRLWNVLGAHRRRIDGVEGVSFSVWAPNARRVSVIGDFCHWDGRLLPMRVLGSSGVFELFVPGVWSGALYKFEIKTRDGAIRVKSDPFAAAMEMPPQTASRVVNSTYEWGDGDWMAGRRARDAHREPLLVYEVHIGSWARIPEEWNRPLTYREVASRLIDHVKRFGFTHIELLPISEHPFAGSWGYQVSGYYAPTARYGTPDDFRHLVDLCHQNGVGVILDWVPAHFPKDDFALRQFDGTALYEHEDPRVGEHPDWGTLIFNYARHEVRNFLVANALYWLDEFHVDGLRVDAVASMLYLDYSRKKGEWVPNRYGGRENLDALEFLRDLNETARIEQPGTMVIAEESTSWPGVTRPVSEGGLGFTLKWNMGWMNDTLQYFKRDPIHRRFHLNDLTFAMLYEQSERFLMPLSHDEVVHGKGSLLAKMPGDLWQMFANLRLLLAYQYTRPGKKLLFMGSEIGSLREWNHDTSLDWHLMSTPERIGLAAFLEDLGRIYREEPCLWRADAEAHGFRWIDCEDRDNSVLSYVRRAAPEGAGSEAHLVVVLNLTPVPREDYRIGAPAAGRYALRLSSDDARYGGGGYHVAAVVDTEPIGYHGFPQSMRLRLPPLSAIVLAPANGGASAGSMSESSAGGA